jgi:glycosyltransferase involved in cell wall biosynthesis
MPEKLNICLISREFPPDTAFGGIATFSADTARMLRDRGHDVTVLSQSLGESSVTDFHGVSLHKLRVPPPFGSYRCLPAFILAYNYVVLRELRRCHRQRPFDLIDAPDHLAEGLFAALFSGIPVVTRLHTPYSLLVAMGLNDYRKGVSYYLIKLAEKIALRRSRVLYAPCRDLVRRCDELLSIGDVPVKIFGYPLDLDLFSPAEATGELRPPRLLFLGRLEQRKGIETIAAAFPKLVRNHPGMTLTLVGNDTPNIRGFFSARQFLAAAFAEAGCAAAVRFVEAVPLARLPELFRQHDVVWVPSLYDNFPLICLEAMACGKAVVVADAGGLPEMVTHGETGMVFPAGDAEGLAERTLELCAAPELRRTLGRNARAYTEQHCSRDVIYERTMELYRVALTGKRDGMPTAAR